MDSVYFIGKLIFGWLKTIKNDHRSNRKSEFGHVIEKYERATIHAKCVFCVDATSSFISPWNENYLLRSLKIPPDKTNRDSYNWIIIQSNLSRFVNALIRRRWIKSLLRDILIERFMYWNKSIFIVKLLMINERWLIMFGAAACCSLFDLYIVDSLIRNYRNPLWNSRSASAWYD